MYNFKNDYSEGAHQDILLTLTETNLEETAGYCEDHFSKEAAILIKKTMNHDNVDIHFVAGGTAANLIAISAFLKPYEAVISVSSGHIQTHEAGAIEATGHKVISVFNKTGKLTPKEIENEIELHTDEHMVKPRLVYISNSTELGGIYSKSELLALREVCDQYDLYLYMDGARLGSALMSEASDVSIEDIASTCDAFYIGGTKNGALLGEALVICNDTLKPDFRYMIKQKGGLMAKGRILGIQFYELFKDDLFFQLADHANKMAYKLRDVFLDMGFEFLSPPVSNQLFPILPNPLIDELHHHFEFYVWEKTDEQHSAVRLITSWATSEEKVDGFIKVLRELTHMNPKYTQ